MDIASQYQKALDHHIAGDLASAESLYESILRLQPNQSKILHLSGVLAHQRKELEKAQRRISKAIAIEPEISDFYISLGAVLKANGQLPAALQAFEKAVSLGTVDVELFTELGDISIARGDHAMAIEYFSKAASMAPDDAAGHFNLGLAQRNHGDAQAALSSFERALNLDPELAAAYFEMGNLKNDCGDHLEAICFYRRTLELSPDFCEAHYNMGNAARSGGNSELAADSYHRAIEIRPGFAEAHHNLGLIHKDANRLPQAVRCMETALGHNPDLVAAMYNLGIIEQLQGRFETGLTWFDKARQTRPDYGPARWRWHLSLPIIYEHPHQIDHYRQRFETHLNRLIEETPLITSHDRQTAIDGLGSMTNFLLQYQGRNDRRLQSAYGHFSVRIMKTSYPQWTRPISMPPLPAGEKIRIGYVSSFMHAHTIGEFLAGWLEHHDHDAFEIFCYHIGTKTDPMTERFVRHSSTFHQIGADLEKTATRILADGLHILVYTDIGMNALTTQLASLRLAPIQCKGWGHPVTTGLPTIDYYLSSDLMEPSDAREHYSETLIRLPNLALAYTPPTLPQRPKSRSDFGLNEEAFVCLNTQSLFKLLPQHDDIYPQIAREAPGVQFAFLAHSDPDITAQFARRLKKAFAACGLEYNGYCRILPRQNFPDFLSLNMVSDVLLDSLDWSGGKTTLEAISCGLPVVTLPGNLMRGRHAYAMLSRMGINATIAMDKRDYIRIVVRLCQSDSFYACVKGQVIANRNELYGDRKCIAALENFYRSVCVRKTPKKILIGEADFLVHPGHKRYHGVPFWDAVNSNNWEADTFRVIRKYCTPHTSCIDMGAWIGPTVLYAAHFAGQVYAIEPDRVALGQLKTNLHLNPNLAMKTTVFEGCLSDRTGEMRIGSQTEFGDSETSLLFQDRAKYDVAAAMTFSDFAAAYQIADCGFIKMDIEGAESLILPGMVDFLRDTRPALLISLHPHLYGQRAVETIQMIYAILCESYDSFYHPSGEKIQNLFAGQQPILELVATQRQE